MAQSQSLDGLIAHRPRIQDLPYDVLHLICQFADGADVASLLSTCKGLYTYMKDDAIWREHCARYELEVTSRAVFSHASFYEIYSQILHRYGPMLGLWASDHPYKGSIIEFRLDEDTQGIAGEVWRFRTSRHAEAVMETPQLPEFYTFMTITLPQSPPGAAQDRRAAQLNWHIPHNGAPYFGPVTEFFPVPTLHVLSETNESQFLHYHAGTCALPDFPSPEHAPWLDSARGLPRLPVEPSPRSRPQNPALIPGAAFLYMAPTPATKPRALVVHPAEPGQPEPFAAHESRLQVQDLRYLDLSGDTPRDGPSFYRRFYPLRLPLCPGVDPADERWHPASLEGVWFGAYAAHGTEVLYVYFAEQEREVRAVKITGDLNVPRGVVSWKFALDNRLQPDKFELPHLPHEARQAFGDDLHKVRIYRGTGTLSGTGYLYVLVGQVVP